MQKPLVMVPSQSSTPDLGKVNELLKELIQQFKLANPSSPEVVAICGGYLLAIGQLYDVEMLRNVMRKLVNDERLWKQIRDLKKLRVP